MFVKKSSKYLFNLELFNTWHFIKIGEIDDEISKYRDLVATSNRNHQIIPI